MTIIKHDGPELKIVNATNFIAASRADIDVRISNVERPKHVHVQFVGVDIEVGEKFFCVVSTSRA